MNKVPTKIVIVFFLCILIQCKKENTISSQNDTIFISDPIKVEMVGYNGHIMEPFISKEGSTLFFNNLNEPSENTNLHWAQKITETSFQYKGEISGVNTADLEGVPTMDSAGNFYFVSVRNYFTTLSTLYQGKYTNGEIKNVQLLQGIGKLKPGWVNFDIEVSNDGEYIYFVDALFDQGGKPTTADLVIAKKSANGFERMQNTSEILKNINTSALEYAAGLSSNQLELYFTRLAVPITALSVPEIYYSNRKSTLETFNLPVKIETISGFAEAPTVASDQKTIYFHKRENNRFVLFMTKKI